MAPNEPDSRSEILVASAGVPFGCLVYITAVALLMKCAPRRPQNIRDVVDLPWPVFALLPTAISFVVLLATCALIRNPRLRLWLLVSFGISLIVSSSLGMGLLRRDYIGKF